MRRPTEQTRIQFLHAAKRGSTVGHSVRRLHENIVHIAELVSCTWCTTLCCSIASFFRLTGGEVCWDGRENAASGRFDMPSKGLTDQYAVANYRKITGSKKQKSQLFPAVSLFRTPLRDLRQLVRTQVARIRQESGSCPVVRSRRGGGCPRCFTVSVMLYSLVTNQCGQRTVIRIRLQQATAVQEKAAVLQFTPPYNKTQYRAKN